MLSTAGDREDRLNKASDYVLSLCKKLQKKEREIKAHGRPMHYDLTPNDIWSEGKLKGLRVSVPSSAKECFILSVDLATEISSIDSHLDLPPVGIALSSDELSRAATARYHRYRELAFLRTWAQKAFFQAEEQLHCANKVNQN